MNTPLPIEEEEEEFLSKEQEQFETMKRRGFKRTSPTLGAVPKIYYFICSICRLKWETKIKLEEHMKSHKGDPQTGYSCNKCKSMFKTKETLSNHMKDHTEGQNDGSRPQQESQGINPPVGNPQSMAYTGLFSCNKCKAKFQIKETLNNHMTDHTK